MCNGCLLALLDLQVAIGENLRYGSVELLKQPQPISNNNDVTRIAGSVAGGAAFLLIIFLLLFLYCQNRARTAESEVGRLENDIEKLESNVAQECKSGTLCCCLVNTLPIG